MTKDHKELVKGRMYFIVLNDGEVYHGLYMGWHAASKCCWFKPLSFALAVIGPQWVREDRLQLAIDLGEEVFASAYFERALQNILE